MTDLARRVEEATGRLIARLEAWEAGLVQRHSHRNVRDSKRLEVRCGDLRHLRELAPLIHCAVSLFRSLREREGRYVAVKADGPLNWGITEPRSQEAILFACETDEHAIIERMADALASVCGDDLERAFVLARDCLDAALTKAGAA